VSLPESKRSKSLLTAEYVFESPVPRRVQVVCAPDGRCAVRCQPVSNLMKLPCPSPDGATGIEYRPARLGVVVLGVVVLGVVVLGVVVLGAEDVAGAALPAPTTFRVCWVFAHAVASDTTTATPHAMASRTPVLEDLDTPHTSCCSGRQCLPFRSIAGIPHGRA
jgi:hypothetical protein